VLGSDLLKAGLTDVNPDARHVAYNGSRDVALKAGRPR
jgi:hypothetical protein